MKTNFIASKPTGVGVMTGQIYHLSHLLAFEIIYTHVLCYHFAPFILYYIKLCLFYLHIVAVYFCMQIRIKDVDDVDTPERTG